MKETVYRVVSIDTQNLVLRTTMILGVVTGAVISAISPWLLGGVLVVSLGGTVYNGVKSGVIPRMLKRGD